MELRARYKETFKKKHGVGLGFMSFFVKAAVEALKAFPAVNARIDGNDIVYQQLLRHRRGRQHREGPDGAGASATPTSSASPRSRRRSPTSPIKAREGKIAVDDLQGGTFTITNGGVFGSLLSTPILNPPQSAHPRHARDPEAAGRRRRPDRDPPDDVPGPLLRPPPDRRPRGRQLPGADQGVHREPRAADAGSL